MIKNTVKYVLTVIGILIGSALLGYLLLSLVYMLPTAPMEANVQRGTSIYNDQGSFPELAEGYRSTKLDNDTDSVMLGTAICPVKNPFTDSLRNAEIFVEGRDTRVQSLLDYVNISKDKLSTWKEDYARYWHGYLLLLKPLLLFFDFSDIQMFNMIMQWFTWAMLIASAVKYGHSELLPALFGLMVVWNPTTISLSFQNSDCFYISAVFMILLLVKKKYFSENRMKLYFAFLIAGIVTAFWDFLTYPLVTLGCPLVIWLAVEADGRLRERIRDLLAATLFWGVGYLGMWAEKWILSSLILHENILQNALEQILFHSSSSAYGEEFSRPEALRIQLEVLMKWPYLIIFAIIVLVVFLHALREISLRHAKPDLLQNIKLCVPFLVLALYPFAWYLAASHHSYLNPKFTYRNLGITVLSGIILLNTFLQGQSSDLQ